MKVLERTENIDTEKYLNISSSTGVTSSVLTYDRYIELIINSLELRSRDRLLDLYFGINPITSFILDEAKVNYFALETSHKLVENAMNRFKKNIAKRKALFSVFEENDIPYVNNFFNKILSINPRITNFDLQEYLYLTYQKLSEEGLMSLVFTIKSYEESLKLLECVNVSPFTINDFMIFDVSMYHKSSENHIKSVLFKLSKN